MRGTRAFLKKYNENHIIPITTVSIGGYRNMLKDYLNNIHTDVFPTPNYSTYGYYVNEKKIGTYNGDCKEEQFLVLKKEI